MKKFLALMLSLMLMLGLTLPAMAEDAANKLTVAYDDAMSVEVLIPEGYTVDETSILGALLLIMAPEDGSNNYYCTIIAPDEDVAEVGRLNDLSDEEIQTIVDEFCVDLNNPTVTFGETGMGTKLIIIDDNDVEEGDTVLIVTLYKGYYITTYVFPAGDAVTEAELETAIQFYTDMNFVF